MVKLNSLQGNFEKWSPVIEMGSWNWIDCIGSVINCNKSGVKLTRLSDSDRVDNQHSIQGNLNSRDF